MKLVLFVDFDGTLCFDKFWQNLPKREYSLVQEFLFAKKHPIIIEWMRGTKSSEEVCALLGINIGIDAKLLLEKLEIGCKNMTVEPRALEHIASLRERYTTILSTDNMDCFTRFTVPSLGLSNYFDRIVNSADIGQMKEDADGKLFLDIAGETIRQSILLDNSHSAIGVFSKLGGTGHLVTVKEPLMYWLERIAQNEI